MFTWANKTRGILLFLTSIMLYQIIRAFSNNFYFMHFDAMLFDAYMLMTEFLNVLFTNIKLLFFWSM